MAFSMTPLPARRIRLLPAASSWNEGRPSCQAGAACQASDICVNKKLWPLGVESSVAKKKAVFFRNRMSTLPRCQSARRSGSSAVVSFAMEAMEERLYSSKHNNTKAWHDEVPWAREDVEQRNDRSPFDSDDLEMMPAPSRNRADDLSLKNPLERQHRLGCGWLGVVFEWEGVIVEDDGRLEARAWTALAEEEGRPLPMAFVLKRAQGMKAQHALSEVLCWTRDFQNLKRLAQRKEELYEGMQGGVYRALPGAREFVETLRKYKIPVAVTSTRPRKYLEAAIEAVGMEGFFDVVLCAEDVYRAKPDPEMFEYAAERLGFISERCILIGNCNKTVEAAHDAMMKCIAVAGMHPAYELGAADLVVRRLDDLTMVDLKNLAVVESPEFQPPDFVDGGGLVPEMEEEEMRVLPKLAFMDDDDW